MVDPITSFRMSIIYTVLKQWVDTFDETETFRMSIIYTVLKRMKVVIQQKIPLE